MTSVQVQNIDPNIGSVPTSPLLTEDKIAKSLQFLKARLGDDLKQPAYSANELHEQLKDGVLLCKLVNTITPNFIPKISMKPLPFLQMENINNFIHACASCQIGQNELFEISDLFDGKAMGKVLDTVLALERQLKNGIKPTHSDALKPLKSSQSSASPTKTKSRPTTASTISSSGGDRLSVPSSLPHAISETDFAAAARQEQLESNQKAVLKFLESVLGEPIEGSNLHEILKNGVILCRVMNVLKPNCILSINTAKTFPFLHMENIYNFLQAAKNYGIKTSELFQTSDLYEGRDINAVVSTLVALERIAAQNGFKIAKPSISTSRSVEFQQDKVAEMIKMSTPPSKRRATATKEAKPQKNVEADDNPKGLKLLINEQEYLVGQGIGRGHFGAVYRGLSLETGELVAIKRIPSDESKIDDLKSIMKEVELLSSLSHPNVVSYRGVLQKDGFLNIVLEFVEGGSLQHLQKQFGAMPERLTSLFSKGILEALAHVHQRKIIHLDLKAANILVTKEGVVKLTDFGVSREFSFDSIDTSVAGTPFWMAPEIIELKGATTKSDIWSLGCTIIELMTGKPPYFDCNPMTALFKIVEEDIPPLPATNNPDMIDFLTKVFQKNPDTRPSAQTLLSHPWIQLKTKQQPIQKEPVKGLVVETVAPNQIEPNNTGASLRPSVSTGKLSTTQTGVTKSDSSLNKPSKLQKKQRSQPTDNASSKAASSGCSIM